MPIAQQQSLPYLARVFCVMIFDNSEGKHDLIAKKTLETEIDIFSETKFNKLKNYYHENT